MLGKLIKHEITSVSRWYLGLYGAILLLSAIVGVWLRSFLVRAGIHSIHSAQFESDFYYQPALFEAIIFTVIFLVFLGLFISLALATLFLIIRRFKDSIYGREGYLTLTLPVSHSQLLVSKVAGAIFWQLASGFTTLLSFIIIGGILLGQFTDVPNLAHYLIGWSYWLELTGFLLSFIIASISGTLLIYLAISFGQLFDRSRNVIAFLFYLVLALLIGFINTHLPWSGINADLAMGLENLVLSLVYFYSIRYLLINKVNLD
ncbi:hypothetical protein [Streptococcus sp. DD12]|uniref:hypothetical protein n=1 Tax=Streptococcus sp. DD12 TaxID=1777880 RepID=UPI0007928D04|nr:hypothetical protein [Streptococcus sp. DD12]KXT76204.1 ABC transporter, ATP-binding protein [Streptococcus sp. DD12]